MKNQSTPKTSKAILDFCKSKNLTIDQFYGKATVGGSLYLSGLTSIPDGFNPTVGGDLDLSGLTSIERKKVKENKIDRDSYLFSWKKGKYIKADGIFTEVISKKGNVYKVKKLNNPKEFYLVTDGNGKFSHGDTVKKAKSDLMFKISNRRKEDYNDLTLKSVLKFEDAVVCYRVITGACSFGTKDFVNNKLGKPKKEYKISEVIEVTEGQYGNENFKKFFKK